jgi:hypothetical protein
MAEQTLRLRRGSRKMQYLVDQYRLAHPKGGPDVRPDLVADWAVDKGLWKPLPISPREALRRLIARSLRETYIVDRQGREVRANLPIIEEVKTPDGPKRLSRYYPIFDAPARVARASFALRRRAALADVAQLHFDFLSYNENNHLGERIDALDYNFNTDIEEMSHPTEYESDPDEDEEEEDDED